MRSSGASTRVDPRCLWDLPTGVLEISRVRSQCSGPTSGVILPAWTAAELRVLHETRPEGGMGMMAPFVYEEARADAPITFSSGNLPGSNSLAVARPSERRPVSCEFFAIATARSTWGSGSAFTFQS